MLSFIEGGRLLVDIGWKIVGGILARLLFIMALLGGPAIAAEAAERAPLLAWEDVGNIGSPSFVIQNSAQIFTSRSSGYVGPSAHTWWLKVPLDNFSDQSRDLFVVIPHAQLDSVDMIVEVNGVLSVTRNGSEVPYLERATRSIRPAFKVNLKPGESKTVFLKIRSSFLVQLNYDVVDFGGLLAIERTTLTKLFVSSALLFALLLANLVNFADTRARIFLLYSLYLASAFFYAFDRFGGFPLLGLNPTPLGVSVGILTGAILYSVLSATILLLYSGSASQRFRYILTGALLIPLTILMTSLVSPSLGEVLYRDGAGLFYIVLMATGLVCGYVERLKYSGVILLAWIVIVSTLAIDFAYFNGLLGDAYTGVLVPGLVLEAFIFTLILSSNERYQLQQAGFEERQRSAMERTSQLALIGEQSAVLSHELKQPLNAIRLAVGNMTRSLNRGGESVQDKWPEKLARIDTMVDRAVELTEFVRRSSRQTDDDRPLASFNESMISSRLMLGGDLSASNIELLVEVAEDLPLLMIHPLRLDQLLVNIIGNARDAIRSTDPEKRWIKVSAASSPTDQVLVTIEDSAGGIPEHLLAEIFTKFFTTKDASIGTGLGLSVCRDIAEDVGGSISVSNTENGACFELRVPSDVTTIQ